MKSVVILRKRKHHWSSAVTDGEVVSEIAHFSCLLVKRRLPLELFLWMTKMLGQCRRDLRQRIFL
jgi:hypothetical protein